MTDGCLLYCLFFSLFFFFFPFSFCFIPLGFFFSFPALLLLRIHVHVHVYRSSGCFSFLKTKIKTVFGSASYTSPLYCLPNTFIACLPALSLLCCVHFLAFSCTAQTNDDLTLSCPVLPCLTTLKTHPYSRACRRRYTEYEVPRYHIYSPPAPF